MLFVKQKIAQLLSVKSIITIEIITVFCYLAYSGRIEPNTIVTIVASVISFYFGTVHEKKG